MVVMLFKIEYKFICRHFYIFNEKIKKFNKTCYDKENVNVLCKNKNIMTIDKDIEILIYLN